jgi:hypothetical protein
MEQANWVIDFLNGENSLKSGSNRRVSSISALVSDNKTVALKSSDLADIEIPDTLAYIANFGDDLGFAIISADTRIDEPLFAFTGSGSLVDSIDNPGVIIFLQHLEDYMINSIVEAEHQQDSLLSSILEKLDIEVGTKSTSIEEAKAAARAGRRPVVTTETLNHITPLVPVEWGQGGPFNNGLKDKDCYGEKTPDNGKPWAGCVATAVAHIMSRWEHPSKIGNFSFNWNELNQYTSRPGAYPKAGSRYVSSAPDNVRSQLANLMKQIGDGAGMSHGCYGSSAKTEKAISFLNKHGFSVKMTLMSASNMETTGVLESYNSAKAIASMNRREPLIVEGCSEKTDYKVLGITVNTTYDVCHAWVIDGHLKRRVTTDGVHVETDYIHNNWGWNGYKNGYFKSGVFDSRFEPALASGTKSSKEDGNFQYRLKMTPHIRR